MSQKYSLIFYRQQESDVSALALSQALSRNRFRPCGQTQQTSMGWVAPRGEHEDALVEEIAGQQILCLRTERRKVPAHAVKKRATELADEIQEQTGRKPGKREMRELKEQALMELLPRAFPQASDTLVWISPATDLLCVFASSQARADDVTTQLSKACEGLKMSLLNTQTSPAGAMTHWLTENEAPYAFSIDSECELRSTDEQKAIARFTRQDLARSNVVEHVTEGKVPAWVALTWRERVSFVLTASFQLKKVQLLDVVMEDVEDVDLADTDAAFETNMTLLTQQLLELLQDLLLALDGELQSGSPQSEGVQPAQELATAA